jgi:hypothetical protein
MILLIKRGLSTIDVIYDKIRLVAGLVPKSAHGGQIYSSRKFFLKLLGGDE